MTELDQEAIDRTTRLQTQAADPSRSIWLSANAGAGKTRVLTYRVVRILIESLLAGAPVSPERIVCITFTKAAAAEMSTRLFGMLSKWAIADDDVLRAQITDLLGRPPPTSALPGIRQLFAIALETPGGLKIQTIHSFCERVLRRFPVEAGLIPGFTVLDDEGVALLQTALEALFQRAHRGDVEVGKHLAIAQEKFRSREDLQRGLQQMRSYLPTIQSAEQQGEDPIGALFQALDVDEGDDADDIKRRVIAAIDVRLLQRLEGAIENLAHVKTHQQRCLAAREALPLLETAPSRAFDVLTAGFLTAKGTPPAKPAGKSVTDIFPDWNESVGGLAAALVAAVQQLKNLSVARVTASVTWLTRALEADYTAAKHRLATLDYDDLIVRTGQLLQSTDNTWVMYKLDQGIDHLLVDEAQDTADPQWQVIDWFRNEFVDQEPEAGRTRSLFVVGDGKQSIYSFQGADAALYQRKREETAASICLPHLFEDISLPLSFRSSRIILQFVDELFECEAGTGVRAGAAVVHESAHGQRPGLVELWPPIRKTPVDEPKPWDAPIDAPPLNDPKRQLADRICGKIKSLIAGEDGGHANGRAISAGDVMILCQKRGGLFYEIIKALAANGIPSGGSDRVRIKENVAVRDLLALTRFAVNHDDDLSLAEALKSPLFGWTEEELFALAHPRGRASLWSALRSCAAAPSSGALSEKAQAAIERIDGAERLGAQSGPFAFLSAYLEQGTPSGRYQLRQRLGTTSDEAIDELMHEALRFELSHPRNLGAFLAHFEAFDRDIKKQVPDKADYVRVMTVHGAKGLEAPIVFLADASDKKSFSEAMVPLAEKFSRLPIICNTEMAGTFAPAVEAVAAARERMMDEYRRQLYVAATRAEERLYICGYESGRAKKGSPYDAALAQDPRDASWHALAYQSFDRLTDPIKEQACPWRDDMPVLQLQEGSFPAPEDTAVAQEHAAGVPAPDWLFTPLPAEKAKRAIVPSATSARDVVSVIEAVDDAAGEATAVVGPSAAKGQEGLSPRHRGVVIHYLLQLLPTVPSPERRAVAERLAQQRAPGASSTARSALVDETLRVLEDTAFAPVFGPTAQAEVQIHGTINGQLVTGQVDRLHVTTDTVRVVEVKTHRPPPEDAAKVDLLILRQVALYGALLEKLYPGREIQAALLWTYSPRLMPLPSSLLKHALETVTGAGLAPSDDATKSMPSNET